ncbi:MAG TPA: tetratricopeptide repeat protein [Myxococcota bacterium]|nr:tetratricopeptide repeat protein [Myxococcota bacterium]HRY94167.1 tetratricopeptide repeat protein [Myxococcota bacterium]HSA23188.1 tetratricopeptide repeat protein [Myxococcota bacterium]
MFPTPLFALAGLLAAGAAGPADPLLAELRARLTPAELEGLQLPFAADEDIRRAALDITRSAADPGQRLERLRAHFRAKGYLERYDRDGTRTAREVMATGQGNCLSYANLFVAMARAVGLEAFFLDASQARPERGKSGSLLVEYGHVLVGVRLGPEVQAVEFDGRTRDHRRLRPLTDAQAIADFYNNRGYERSWSQPELGGLGSEAAIADFRLATRIAPDFARAWNNLGVALSRSNRLAEADEAYRRAARREPTFAPPHANLGHSLTRQARLPEAIRAFARAVELDPGHPHYRLFLSRALSRSGRLEEALAQAEQAAALDPAWFLPRLEAALLLERLGHLEAAQSAAGKVLELAPGQRDARRLLEQPAS